MKNTILHSLTVATLALTIGSQASVVTNDVFQIDAATTLSGVTNIYEAVNPGHILADLTLEDHSFVRLRGGNGSNIASAFYIATNANDVSINISGGSALYGSYRNSTSPAAWNGTHIDDGTTNAKESYTKTHVGIPDGASGTTGTFTLTLSDPGTFGVYMCSQPGRVGSGYAAAGGFTAVFHQLDIETSVSPHETGTIDFLQLNDGATAVFGQIAVTNAYPARILFNGGALEWSHSLVASLPIKTLSPYAGCELILEGVNGNPVKFRKTDRGGDLTGRLGGTVRFRGGDVILAADKNTVVWNLASSDKVAWEQTGDLILQDGINLKMGNGYMLPYAQGKGILRLRSSGDTAAKRAILDMPNHDQAINGLVADGDGAQYSMVTNTAGSAVRNIILDARSENFVVPFGVACSDKIKVTKRGTGRLDFVGNTRVADFEVAAACPVSFAGTNRFVKLTYKGVTLPSFVGEVWIDGVLDLSTLASGTYDLPQTSVHLGPSGSIALGAGAALNLPRLTVGGVKVPSGVYDSSAAWLSGGRVTIGTPATVISVR